MLESLFWTFSFMAARAWVKMAHFNNCKMHSGRCEPNHTYRKNSPNGSYCNRQRLCRPNYMTYWIHLIYPFCVQLKTQTRVYSDFKQN